MVAFSTNVSYATGPGCCAAIAAETAAAAAAAAPAGRICCASAAGASEPIMDSAATAQSAARRMRVFMRSSKEQYARVVRREHSLPRRSIHMKFSDFELRGDNIGERDRRKRHAAVGGNLRGAGAVCVRTFDRAFDARRVH